MGLEAAGAMSRSPSAKRHTSSVSLKILVDMDGVLCDFEAYLLEQFRSKFPDEPFIPVSERNTFYAHEQYGSIKVELKRNITDIMSSPGFFASLRPISNAVTCMHWMRDIPDVSVWICTSPINKYRNCVSEKYQWVEKHLGFEWTKRVIMCKDKTLIKGDYLIDDRPMIHGEEQFKPNFGKHVVFTQPYNCNVTTEWRLSLWPERKDKLLDFIMFLREGLAFRD